MKIRSLALAALTVAATALLSTEADACTNIIVTKGASTDNSNLVSYAADSHWLFGELYFHPAQDWKNGDKLRINEWDTGKYLGTIDQVAHTYKTIGNMNEHQLIITETTWGGRLELMDRKGKIDYGSLIYITLQRAKTAREAIKVMSELVNTYGYASEGESFSIADKDEVWIMELIGKGEKMNGEANMDKGAVWVAVRIPDGYISGHANQARITTFPLDDPDNCLYSPDVITFAREKGYFSGEDKDFSFCDAYCPLDFGTIRGCDARVWSAFNILGEGTFTFIDKDGAQVSRSANSYLDYALGYDTSERLPLYIKPAKKISVKDVADVMRDHYEGTPMDMTQDIGAGGNALPYRWRPMTFKYEGKEYLNERAIATQQTGFWLVGQARADMPDAIGGILWFGTDDAATSYVTPIYTSTTKVPSCFKEGNGNLITYSSSSSFWINNRISNACYKMYNHMAPYVRERIDAFENEQIEKVREMDRNAMDKFEKIAARQIKAHGNDAGYDVYSDVGRHFSPLFSQTTGFSIGTAQNQFQAWKDLEIKLLVKFIDGNVKAEDENGKFVSNDFSPAIPDGLTQPGYTDCWKEAVAKFHGEAIEIPSETSNE